MANAEPIRPSHSGRRLHGSASAWKKEREYWRTQLPMPCPRCSQMVMPWDMWDLDHIDIPVALGGTDSRLRPAHRSCNRKAGRELGAAIKRAGIKAIRDHIDNDIDNQSPALEFPPNSELNSNSKSINDIDFSGERATRPGHSPPLVPSPGVWPTSHAADKPADKRPDKHAFPGLPPELHSIPGNIPELTGIYPQSPTDSDNGILPDQGVTTPRPSAALWRRAPC